MAATEQSTAMANETIFRADLKLAPATLSAIDAACSAAADDGMRPHLGASLIGRSCDRALWYTFRWATAAQHDPRILRLFARGQREEDNLADLLRKAGVTVMQTDPATGQQFRFGSGHFSGSMDGACLGLPDAPKTWHVLEFKTASAKAFNDLAKKGVQASKPEHWAQMQCYMAWTGMTRALYVAVCKDDDRLHLERIDADPQAAQRYMDRAARIIHAATPPEGISTDAAYYECKWCEHRDTCHGTAAPVPTCRSCTHSTPEAGGLWACARHSNRALSVPDQKTGCTAHRYIPILLKNWAEPVDANEPDNWVRYQTASGEFTNGTPPQGIGSDEIHAAQDKQALAVVASEFQQLRQDFGAKVVA